MDATIVLPAIPRYSGGDPTASSHIQAEAGASRRLRMIVFAEMRGALGHRRRVALLLGVALAAGGFSVLGYTHHLLRRPEQQTIDARFQIRGTERRKVGGFGCRGARLIAFDVQFTGPPIRAMTMR